MKSAQSMLEEAREVVPAISTEEAMQKVEQGALLLDVRDGTELQTNGRVAGAKHVPRGLLEFKADPDSQAHDPAFQRDREIVIYCASGGRATLAGKTLHDMGFEKVFSAGGLKDFQETGVAIEMPTSK